MYKTIYEDNLKYSVLFELSSISTAHLPHDSSKDSVLDTQGLVLALALPQLPAVWIPGFLSLAGVSEPIK